MSFLRYLFLNCILVPIKKEAQAVLELQCVSNGGALHTSLEQFLENIPGIRNLMEEWDWIFNFSLKKSILKHSTPKSSAPLSQVAHY